MTDAVFGQITAIFTFGGLLGSVMTGGVMNRWGRKGAIKLSAILTGLGSALFAISASVNAMLFAR